MIYIKLAGKESCDMTVCILYTRVRMTHDCSHSGIVIHVCMQVGISVS
jgi:hypothetical protein